ncbi:MAG: LPS assembly protein LptD [Holosporaceae bacterium]|jgi:LPS-assembly protein|nr:LPS assembly protein LptD [Holosporaceae bacterium]
MNRKILAVIGMAFLFLDAFSEDLTVINSDNTQYTRNTVHCSGNVIIVYYNRIISADTIFCDKEKKVIRAHGNVIIKDEKQNVYFLDTLSVSENFSTGEGKNIKIIMPDQSRLAAAKFLIKNGKYELKNVIFTPCYDCSHFEELTWQLKAQSVIFDPENYVEYRNLNFEFFGTTIFHVPYLAHVSPKIERKSGFLVPRFSISTKSGFSISPQYLFTISDSQELILKPIITSKIGNVGWVYYGLRFFHGEFNVDASITTTKFTEEPNSNSSNYEKTVIKKIQNSKYRGHIFSKLKYEIDNIWRCGFDINLASDKYYLQKFPFLENTDRLLKSEIKLEGFDGENYTSVKTTMFQSENSEYAPRILPIIERNYATNIFSGTLGLDAYFMNLDFHNHKSAQKVVSNVSWKKEILLLQGHILDFKSVLSLYGLKVSEKERSDYDSSFTTQSQINVTWKWPLVWVLSNYMYTIVTPIVGVTFAGNKKNIDVFEDPFCEINHINFLEGNKCISSYNIDSGDRICYGLKLSGYRDGENLYHFIVGRSTELTSIPNRLEATGLKYRNSNIVSSLDISLPNEWTFVMNSSYSSRSKSWSTIEAGLDYSNKKICLDFMVFRGKQCFYNPFAVDYKIIPEEQKIQKYKGIMFNVGWNVTASTKLKGGVIIGNEIDTLTMKSVDKFHTVRRSIGIEYKNECTTVDFIVEQRSHTIDDLKSETVFQLVVHLKNLGI